MYFGISRPVPKSFKSFFILLFPFPACFIQSAGFCRAFYRFEFSPVGNSHLSFDNVQAWGIYGFFRIETANLLL